MGEYTYIPSIVLSVFDNTNIFSLLNEKVDKKINIGWWSENSLFKYPKVLVSAFYAIKHPFLRKEFMFPDDGLFVGDSGGFQNYTLVEKYGKKISLNPVDVFNWQKENCDMAFPLDYPPASTDPVTLSKALSISEKNFEISENLYGNYHDSGGRKLKLYNVFQGFGMSKVCMDSWIKMAEKYELITSTGWGIGLHPEGTPFMIAVLAMYLYSKGYKKNFHFFGPAFARTIPIMVFLTNYIENVSSDSSSWATGRLYRKFIVPGMLGKFAFHFSGVNETRKSIIKTNPCSCPVCNKIGKDTSLFYSEGTIGGALISLHNLYQIIQYVNLCNSMKEDDALFRDFISKHCGKEVVKAVEFIDYSLRHGFDKAYIKFSSELVRTNLPLSTNTTGLLDF